MNPRALMCEILGLTEEQARPYIAGDKDGHPEVARALAAIARYDAAIRQETIDQLWGEPA